MKEKRKPIKFYCKLCTRRQISSCYWENKTKGINSYCRFCGRIIKPLEIISNQKFCKKCGLKLRHNNLSRLCRQCYLKEHGKKKIKQKRN